MFLQQLSDPSIHIIIFMSIAEYWLDISLITDCF